ncbi:hypothetical protein [Pseudonocardia sp.]|uniref:hypothetical protein n=1 Tax=Pseudonocardia sp. TaxID=60912 RepID=UPI003D136519
MPKLTMPKWWLVWPIVGMYATAWVLFGFTVVAVSAVGSVIVGVGHARSLKRREARWDAQRLCTCQPPAEGDGDGPALPSVCLLHGVRRRGEPRGDRQQ